MPPMRFQFLCAAIAAAASLSTGAFAQTPAATYDVVIRNGRVLTGTGFHHHSVTAAGAQFLDGLGRRGHTRLARTNLGRDADAHRVEPLGSRLDSTAHGALTDFI